MLRFQENRVWKLIEYRGNFQWNTFKVYFVESDDLNENIPFYFISQFYVEYLHVRSIWNYPNWSILDKFFSRTTALKEEISTHPVSLRHSVFLRGKDFNNESSWNESCCHCATFGIARNGKKGEGREDKKGEEDERPAKRDDDVEFPGRWMSFRQRVTRRHRPPCCLGIDFPARCQIALRVCIASRPTQRCI